MKRLLKLGFYGGLLLVIVSSAYNSGYNSGYHSGRLSAQEVKELPPVVVPVVSSGQPTRAVPATLQTGTVPLSPKQPGAVRYKKAVEDERGVTHLQPEPRRSGYIQAGPPGSAQVPLAKSAVLSGESPPITAVRQAVFVQPDPQRSVYDRLPQSTAVQPQSAAQPTPPMPLPVPNRGQLRPLQSVPRTAPAPTVISAPAGNDCDCGRKQQ